MKTFGGIPHVLIAFQLLAVLALPLALCCCLNMTAEAAAHGASGHAGHEDGGASPCPHHHPAPADNPTNEADPGCHRLVQLVLVLAGLIGIWDVAPSSTAQLPSTDAPVAMSAMGTDFISPIDSPPPRL